MTHDYKRHGTTILFAAFNTLDGIVLGRCMQRHRHQEFIRFLNAVDRAVPVGKLVHAILDNHATHTHAKVKAWLARHPRWTFHFTPKSGSWLNAVEGFFSSSSDCLYLPYVSVHPARMCRCTRPTSLEPVAVQ